MSLDLFWQRDFWGKQDLRQLMINRQAVRRSH